MSDKKDVPTTSTGDDKASGEHPGQDGGSKKFSKTPMFQAMHMERYSRQSQIMLIQEKTEKKLICYVSGIEANISRDDTLGFGDLLHNVSQNEDLDLLLHTGGGDIDAAEKLISMVRTKVGTGHLRVIVPDYAKSAGTLMALSADQIVMSDTSELGPIDPQILLNDGCGNVRWSSAKNYLDAYKTHSEELQSDPSNVSASMMLNKLSPIIVKSCEAVCQRALKFAEQQLQQGMFRDKPGNFTDIAKIFMDTDRWLSHGQMIGYQDAQEFGVAVQYLTPDNAEWQCFWKLYCCQRLAVKDRQKLFESDYASLVFDA